MWCHHATFMLHVMPLSRKVPPSAVCQSDLATIESPFVCHISISSQNCSVPSHCFGPFRWRREHADPGTAVGRQVIGKASTEAWGFDPGLEIGSLASSSKFPPESYLFGAILEISDEVSPSMCSWYWFLATVSTGTVFIINVILHYAVYCICHLKYPLRKKVSMYLFINWLGKYNNASRKMVTLLGKIDRVSLSTKEKLSEIVDNDWSVLNALNIYANPIQPFEKLHKTHQSYSEN